VAIRKGRRGIRKKKRGFASEFPVGRGGQNKDWLTFPKGEYNRGGKGNGKLTLEAEKVRGTRSGEKRAGKAQK